MQQVLIKRTNFTGLLTWSSYAMLYVMLLALDRKLVLFFDYFPAVSLSSGAAFFITYRLGYKVVYLLSLLGYMVLSSLGFSSLESLVFCLVSPLGAVLANYFNGQLAKHHQLDVLGARSMGALPVSRLLLILGLPYLCLVLVLQQVLRLSVFQDSLVSQDGLLTAWFACLLGALTFTACLHLRLSDVIAKTKKAGSKDFKLLFVTSAILVSLLLTGSWYSGIEGVPLTYLLFPLLLWSVFRFSAGVDVVVVIIAMISIELNTSMGRGVFVRTSIEETYFLIQAFFGVAVLMMILLRRTLQARSAAQKETQRAYAELEDRVESRTQEISAMMQTLAESNRMKSRFLAAASHDLRQPVHAASLFSSALETRVKSNIERECVENIQRSISSLREMLDGLLDMSRLEHEAIVAKKTDIPIQEILDAAVSELDKAQASTKGLSIKVARSSALVHTDRDLLLRVVSNFVTNAIRYTDYGSVLLGCRNRGAMVELQVLDTGVGIEEDDLEFVFQPHKRLKGKTYSAHDGLGLGLSIVEGLASVLDHDLLLRSNPGRGSIFSILIPRATSRENICVTKKAPVGQVVAISKTCLVIDDDLINLSAMSSLLEAWGCHVWRSSSVDEALSLAISLGARLDVVVSDYHLSDRLNGVQLVEKIRGIANANIQGVIVTADTQTERHNEVRAAGFGLGVKPVDSAILQQLIQ